MSMLAERRCRKAYNIIPRGKPLYQDENHFGTRMLKKMGWTEGKGLGANENGSVEFVRVKYKNNSVGFGYEDRDSQWMEHHKKFNEFLEYLDCIDSVGNNLSQINNNDEVDSNVSNTIGFRFNNDKTKKSLKDKLSGESLEGKSKKSKVRVHYKKFTKQKDISQYSEKDLANIFGKKFDIQIGNAKEENNVKADEDKTSNTNILEFSKSKYKNLTDQSSTIIADEKIKEPKNKKIHSEDNTLNTTILKSSKSKYKNLTDQSSTVIADEEIKEPKNKRRIHLEYIPCEPIDTLERNLSNSIEKPSKIIDQSKCEQQEYRKPEKYIVNTYYLNILTQVDCNQFKGSNIKDIRGYGIDNEIEISSKSVLKTSEVAFIATEKNKCEVYDKQNNKEKVEPEKTNPKKKKIRKHMKKSILK